MAHLLRDCPTARHVWTKVFGGTHRAEISLVPYNVGYLATFARQDDIWPSYFAITCWWIWRWTNCWIFGLKQEIPIDISGFLYTSEI